MPIPVPRIRAKQVTGSPLVRAVQISRLSPEAVLCRVSKYAHDPDTLEIERRRAISRHTPLHCRRAITVAPGRQTDWREFTFLSNEDRRIDEI